VPIAARGYGSSRDLLWIDGIIAVFRFHVTQWRGIICNGGRAGLASDRTCALSSNKAGITRPLCIYADIPAYRPYEPVCCIRVACASPATVLAAEATGAMAAVRVRAAKAARTKLFIGLSPFSVGRDVRLRWMDRWTYAGRMIIGLRGIGFMRKMMKSGSGPPDMAKLRHC
jgi:hypothetical protein